MKSLKTRAQKPTVSDGTEAEGRCVGFSAEELSQSQCVPLHQLVFFLAFVQMKMDYIPGFTLSGTCVKAGGSPTHGA